MNKKALIFLIILAAVAGGFFYLWLSQPVKEPEEVSQPPRWSPAEDYVIEERPEGKFVVNEKAGLSFKVPEGWKVNIEGEEALVELFSPDAELDQNNVLNKGCRILATVYYQEEEFVRIKNQIESVKETSEKSKEEYGVTYKVVEISGYSALKGIGTEKPKIGQSIEMALPIEEGEIIGIGTQILSEYKERCLKEFDEFLETIVIK